MNEKEKYYIQYYKTQTNINIYNIAAGGDGGNVFAYASLEDKTEFINKMTKINQKRCCTEGFKQQTSKRMKEKYSNPEERRKQSELLKEIWSDPELRKRNGERIKEHFKKHKRDNSYNCKPCVFELGEQKIYFDSVGDLLAFLKTEYDFCLSRPSQHDYFADGKNRIPYNPIRKKQAPLKGMLVYFQKDENVETMGDECSPVECEIGTHPKRKTTSESDVEDIVRAA